MSNPNIRFVSREEFFHTIEWGFTPETTIFDIMLTDDELDDRENWVRSLMDRPEPQDEEFELDLDNWESNR